MIQGRLVNVRKLRTNDIPHLVKWFQDSNILEYYDRFPLKRSWEIERDMNHQMNSINSLNFIIENKKGEPLGLCYLSRINWINRNAEIHILIGDSTKRGLMFGAEAELHVLMYSFQSLNLHKVYARIISYATSAEKLVKDVGFVLEATVKNKYYQNGRYWDLNIYGLLDREFLEFVNSPKGLKYLEATKSNQTGSKC